jgi:hypothetical protein
MSKTHKKTVSRINSAKMSIATPFQSLVCWKNIKCEQNMWCCVENWLLITINSFYKTENASGTSYFTSVSYLS